MAADKKHDGKIVMTAIIGVLCLWGLLASLPLIALRSSWFVVKDVDHVKSVLSQLGTYGDMFGALTCLFTGLAFIGAGYAVVLQLRALRHQQEEIEQNRLDQEAATKAREKELRESALWERRTAALNATRFLAQIYLAKIAAIPQGDIQQRAERADAEAKLEEMTTLIANLLEQFSKEQVELLRRADQAESDR
jgi:hypothetical protein